jgi:hypothetical protein
MLKIEETQQSDWNVEAIAARSDALLEGSSRVVLVVAESPG